jgi:hypothetical protein
LNDAIKIQETSFIGELQQQQQSTSADALVDQQPPPSEQPMIPIRIDNIAAQNMQTSREIKSFLKVSQEREEKRGDEILL